MTNFVDPRQIYIGLLQDLRELQYREINNADPTGKLKFSGESDVMLKTYTLALQSFCRDLPHEKKREVETAIGVLNSITITKTSSHRLEEIKQAINELAPGKDIYLFGGHIKHHALIRYSKDGEGHLFRTEYNAGSGCYHNPDGTTYGVCKQQILHSLDQVVELDITNQHSSREEYQNVSNALSEGSKPILSKPILPGSRKVATQHIGNCNTRSTRELLRELLSEQTFREMFYYLTHKKPQEILAAAGYNADKDIYQTTSQHSLFSHSNKIHATILKIIQEDLPDLFENNEAFQKELLEVLKRVYPVISVSDAVAIAKTCIALIGGHSYKNSDSLSELEEQLNALSKRNAPQADFFDMKNTIITNSSDARTSPDKSSTMSEYNIYFNDNRKPNNMSLSELFNILIPAQKAIISENIIADEKTIEKEAIVQVIKHGIEKGIFTPEEIPKEYNHLYQPEPTNSGHKPSL